MRSASSKFARLVLALSKASSAPLRPSLVPSGATTARGVCRLSWLSPAMVNILGQTLRVAWRERSSRVSRQLVLARAHLSLPLFILAALDEAKIVHGTLLRLRPVDFVASVSSRHRSTARKRPRASGFLDVCSRNVSRIPRARDDAHLVFDVSVRRIVHVGFLFHHARRRFASAPRALAPRARAPASRRSTDRARRTRAPADSHPTDPTDRARRTRSWTDGFLESRPVHRIHPRARDPRGASPRCTSTGRDSP